MKSDNEAEYILWKSSLYQKPYFSTDSIVQIYSPMWRRGKEQGKNFFVLSFLYMEYIGGY